jgi:hypothetical protein
MMMQNQIGKILYVVTSTSIEISATRLDNTRVSNASGNLLGSVVAIGALVIHLFV